MMIPFTVNLIMKDTKNEAIAMIDTIEGDSDLRVEISVTAEVMVEIREEMAEIREDRHQCMNDVRCVIRACVVDSVEDTILGDYYGTQEKNRASTI